MRRSPFLHLPEQLPQHDEGGGGQDGLGHRLGVGKAVEGEEGIEE